MGLDQAQGFWLALRMKLDEEADWELNRGAAPRPTWGERLARPSLFLLLFVTIGVLVWIVEMARIYLEPPLYEGVCVIEFLPPNGGDAEFQREFQILQSQRSLNGVVEQLELDKNGGELQTKYEALLMLQAATEFEPIANYRMARVTVRYTNASLAAKMADAIPAAYAQRRIKNREAVSGRQMDMLEAQILAVRDRTEKARVKWHDIVDQYQAMHVENSPVIIVNSRSIDPRAIKDEEEFVDYISARRALIVAEEAKAEYDLHSKRLREMEQDLILAKTAPPGSSPVLVHQHAVIPTAPALPDVDGGMASGKLKAIVIGLVGAIIALLLIPSSKRKRKAAVEQENEEIETEADPEMEADPA
jgi:hypothetical protein